VPCMSGCGTSSPRNDARKAVSATIEEGIALQRVGRLKDAEEVYRERLATAPNDAEALHYLGLVHYQLGNLEAAEPLIARSLRIAPACVNALNDLGVIKLKKAQREEAIQLFARALSLNKDHTDALNNMAEGLKQLHRFDQALVMLRRLAWLKPNSSEVMRSLAEAFYGSHHTTAALDSYHEAIRLDPENQRARLALADLCEDMGKYKQARMQYDAVLRRDPENPTALSKVLQLPGSVIAARWVRSTERLAAETSDQTVRTRLNVALARYHDREGQYDRAFDFLAVAHAHDVLTRPFDAAGYTRAIDLILEALPGEFFRRAVTSGVLSERPIFVVGMPRSGTTLVEQILCSHSRVAAGGELVALPNASSRILDLSSHRRPYPWGLQDLDAEQLATLARGYLDRLDKLYSDDRKVTDKLPFNFMHVGVIALALPKAKIVHCRRDPRDTCLSCYFTSFADENQFANDLVTLGRYYADYHRLMEHWHSVLPGRIFDLQYEDLITDPETTIRNLVGYCGLEWEDSCLAFHETQRDIRTPSRWQVRRPIYRGSVGRWRSYAKHLGPLEQALGSRSP
jgi:tetratricopeptide (TPR) repeat protein